MTPRIVLITIVALLVSAGTWRVSACHNDVYLLSSVFMLASQRPETHCWYIACAHCPAALTQAACTADEVNAAFVRAKRCVDSHNSVAPEVSDKTKFCNHVKEVGDHCFEKCACMAVDSCDGNTKAVAPLANQAQKDIFEGVCNSHNDNGCSGEFNPKCAAAAAAAGLRAGVVTMLVVAAFALLVGH